MALRLQGRTYDLTFRKKDRYAALKLSLFASLDEWDMKKCQFA